MVSNVSYSLLALPYVSTLTPTQRYRMEVPTYQRFTKEKTSGVIGNSTREGKNPTAVFCTCVTILITNELRSKNAHTVGGYCTFPSVLNPLIAHSWVCIPGKRALLRYTASTPLERMVTCGHPNNAV